MEKSDNHLDIINYLYGEMDAVERARFEKRLESDSTLKEEVEALKKTRNLLLRFPHKEVKTSVDTNVSFGWEKNKQFRYRIQTLLAVAASIVIVLIAGYSTNFSVRYSEGELVIGFPSNSSVAYPDREEVKGIVKGEMASQRAELENKWQQTRDSLQQFYTLRALQEIQPIKTQQTSAPQRGVSEVELRKEMANWQNSNQKLLQQYFTALNTQQQEYLQEALTQFSDYLQQQREQDLLMIQQNLVDLKDYQDQQKRETNQVLSGLLKTVKQPE